MSDQEGDDAGATRVGYRNPPIATRFKKGQSGNPKGRPRKKPTLSEALEVALDARVTVTQNGVRVTKSKRELAALTLANGIAKGEQWAVKLYFDLTRRGSPDTASPAEVSADLDDHVATIEAFMRRRGGSSPDEQ